jgi:ubiquinone/menaquinone biosynthesis C-methylase UbiE
MYSLKGEVPMAGHCCPWWLNYVIGSPLRRWLQPPEQVFGDLVRPGMSILDAGCGMGVFTMPLAEMAGPRGRVVAVDFDPRNLRVVERKARRRGFGGRVSTLACDMGVLPLDGHSFDFALAANSVHEVPDYPRFFVRLHKLLAPGGKFLLLEPSFHMTEKDFQTELERAADSGLMLAGLRTGVRRSFGALLEKPA